MADTVGVSKSAVSRDAIEASERVLAELMEQRLDAWDLLVVYLDGIQFGAYHVLAAVGVDTEGKKPVLGCPGGRERERRGDPSPAGGPCGSGPGPGASAPVRDRRLEGAQEGNRPDLRTSTRSSDPNRFSATVTTSCVTSRAT